MFALVFWLWLFALAVFPDNGTLITIIAVSLAVAIRIVKYLREFSRQNIVLKSYLDDRELQARALDIEKYTITTERFVQKFEAYYGSANLELKNSSGEVINVCPVCGSLMQLKRGARGLFLGCSAWPKCDFTRESESILK